jgi:hypothetical protein
MQMPQHQWLLLVQDGVTLSTFQHVLKGPAFTTLIIDTGDSKGDRPSKSWCTELLHEQHF